MATKDFIEFTPSTGSNNASISVTASNNTGEARSTSLNIKGEGITKSISINQKLGITYMIIIGSEGKIEKVGIN